MLSMPDFDVRLGLTQYTHHGALLCVSREELHIHISPLHINFHISSSFYLWDTRVRTFCKLRLDNAAN